MKRKQFLQQSAFGIFAAMSHQNALLAESQTNITGKRFSIGACDWSISNTSNLGAMEMAKEIGLDGVQLSLGLKANNMHLRRKDVQEAYKSLAKIFFLKKRQPNKSFLSLIKRLIKLLTLDMLKVGRLCFPSEEYSKLDISEGMYK